MPTSKNRLARRSSAAVRAALLTALAVAAAPAFPQGPTTGPDVTVIYLGSTSNYGAIGGIRAYSVGTTSCNIGSEPVNWCDATFGCGGTLDRTQHPVIAQNLYRLSSAGRFEQIGMSWLKHGFVSTNSTDASCRSGHPSCGPNPMGGDQLGVGCTDTYGSGLNGGGGSTCDGGSGCRLGQRSQVDPTSGEYPMPYANIPHPQAIDQRLQVLQTDVDPAANPGALYWVEGQYISDNDAQAGNGLNNASYRKVWVNSTTFNLVFANPTPPPAETSSTIREKTAIQAWKSVDPSVELFNDDFCTAPVERFEVARKVTGSGPWHYEYVVRNLNSDHAAQRFSVDFPGAATITNVGFKDIDSHSGEPYSTTDWTPTVDGAAGTVSWSTETFAANNDANALRWATMYNFWFDANVAPQDAQHSIGLFKPAALADAGSDVLVCSGDAAQIGTAAIPGQTYLWSPGGATTAQLAVSPAATTVYTVTATSACGSTQDTVTVSVEPLLDAPAPLSPADGAVGLQPPVALAWSSVDGATAYTVEVATDSGFTQIVASQTLAATATTVGSLGGVQHFWRVRANGACSGSPSTAFAFTVDASLFSDGFDLGHTNAWSLAQP
jgi:hypothetical protein